MSLRAAPPLRLVPPTGVSMGAYQLAMHKERPALFRSCLRLDQGRQLSRAAAGRASSNATGQGQTGMSPCPGL